MQAEDECNDECNGQKFQIDTIEPHCFIETGTEIFNFIKLMFRYILIRNDIVIPGSRKQSPMEEGLVN